MSSRTYQSWGGLSKDDQEIIHLSFRHNTLPQPLKKKFYLPFGNGRSYGDSCLNDHGVLVDCRGLDRLISFDEAKGILKCEAGCLLGDILEIIVPRGWFLPVVPGTQQITVGGAIANDVHGKNHHHAGSFGCHVLSFELLRSSGERILCSLEQNHDLFCATLGGLGLTGVIVWAEIQLRRVQSAYFDTEVFRFPDLDSFFSISQESDKNFEYTAAWIDTLACKKNLGRGIFFRGNHANGKKITHSRSLFSIPLALPFSVVGARSARLFNAVYFHVHPEEPKKSLVPYTRFLFPLDRVLHWNRLYGKKGFFQFQGVVPNPSGKEVVQEILKEVSTSGQGSFLSVLKVFGEKASPGILSFPRPGITIAMDFPNKGDRILKLMIRLNEIVRNQGGAVYPAKDACMSPDDFCHAYPNLDRFVALMDPKFSSSFWRRVMGEDP